ncbi:hypothetical protein SAY87_000230 [Trapa incisa]|uniref:Secreted protein n=1 Tax=Trapa incisa TaxID=236973 RepID=A0AAN7GRC9_9MYRT|nr:hypothetical protein SAY87_000230 [Trapa incisa]
MRRLRLALILLVLGSLKSVPLCKCLYEMYVLFSLHDLHLVKDKFTHVSKTYLVCLSICIFTIPHASFLFHLVIKTDLIKKFKMGEILAHFSVHFAVQHNTDSTFLVHVSRVSNMYLNVRDRRDDLCYYCYEILCDE